MKSSIQVSISAFSIHLIIFYIVRNNRSTYDGDNPRQAELKRMQKIRKKENIPLATARFELPTSWSNSLQIAPQDHSVLLSCLVLSFKPVIYRSLETGLRPVLFSLVLYIYTVTKLLRSFICNTGKI